MSPDLDRDAARRAAAHAAGLYPAPATPGRSRNMQAIRRANTKPELALRSALHRAGYRFRKDFRIDAGGLTVRPDIVFTRQRVAIFVDGCFWHSCPQHGRVPTSNEWYWKEKLERNRCRDRSVNRALLSDNWRVVRFWEHEKPGDNATTIAQLLFPTNEQP